MKDMTSTPAHIQEIVTAVKQIEYTLLLPPEIEPPFLPADYF